MTDIVKGLFGVSPEELAQQRAEQLNTQASAFAQLSPEARASSALYRGGNQLAGAVGGMLGGQDPQMKKSADLQSILQSGDYNTFEGATAMAKQAAAMGYGNEAQQMYAHAQGLRKSAADIAKTEAETAKALREKQGSDPLQQLIRTGKYTTASVEKYAVSGKVSDLENVEKADQTALSETSEGIFLVNKTTGEKIARIGSPLDRSTRVSVSAVNKGAEAGAVEIAKLDAKRLEGAQAASDKAIESASVLQQLANTPQGVVGAGAPARVAALRVFSTVGLTSAKDNEALGNADTFNTLAGERVLGFIKSLGTNPTDTDREFARSIGPALEKGTKTNQDLVAYLLKRSNDTVTAAKAMETHFYGNNYSLKGYVSPFASNLKPTNPLQGLSDAELAAKIEAAKKR